MDSIQSGNDQDTQAKKTSILKNALSIIIPLTLGVIILWFLYKDTDFNTMWAIIKDANYGILAFSLLFGLLGNTIRAYRWNVLITPLGYKPQISNLAFAVYGSYAVNFALPRAGEIWRCGIVSKDEKIPFIKLFGTIVVDRVLDLLTVSFISFIAFLLNMDFFISYIKQNEVLFEEISNFLASPFPYIIIILLVALIVFIFKFFKKNSFIIKIKKFFLDIARDMKMILHMKQKRKLFLYTLGIWGSYFFIST